jgi:phage terminase small subunit
MRFVQEFLLDLNGTQAAIRSGYSEHTARSIANENLTKPAIQLAISRAFLARSERAEVSQDYVLRNLVKNVERSMQAEPVLDRAGNPTGEYAYHGSVANKALELLGKHLGMFADQQVVSGPNGGSVKLSLDEIRRGLGLDD